MAIPQAVTAGLLKIAEVCEALRVSDWTLAAWRKSGFGPPFLRLKGNDVRYPSDKLQKWCDERTVSSLAEERGKGQRFPGSEKGGFK